MCLLLDVNWVAVLVGAVFNTALGAVWYGPLFGKIWRRVVGKSAADVKASATMYLLPLLAGLASSYVLAAVIAGVGLTLWWHGALFGAAIWLGIGGAATLTTGTFEGSPRGAWLLFSAYQLIVCASQGLMFTLWR
jgi:hypothetical protein